MALSGVWGKAAARGRGRLVVRSRCYRSSGRVESEQPQEALVVEEFLLLRVELVVSQHAIITEVAEAF